MFIGHGSRNVRDVHDQRMRLTTDISQLQWWQQPMQAFANLPRSLFLLVGGVLMTAVYYGGFTARYSLAEHGSKPMQSIATLNSMAASGALIYAVGFAVLFGLYWLGLHFGLLSASRVQWLIVAAFALIFNISLLQMAPVDAADVYDNIIRGRMSAVYGLNPLHGAPSQVRFDPFYGFAAWHDVPSAYGPVWEILAAWTSRLAANDHNSNVLAFKWLSILGYGITAIFIGLTLHVTAPNRALLGVYLFTWNPLVVYMTSAGGHNDLVMTACMLISIYCLVRRWYGASTLGALVGMLVKFMPIVMVPIIAFVALRDLRGAARVRFLMVSGITGAIVIFASYAPYWTGFSTLDFARRGSMFTSSAATLARQALSTIFDGKLPDSGSTPITNAIIGRTVLLWFGLFFLSQIVSLYGKRDPVQPVRVLTAAMLFYLLVAAIWFQSWYVLWVVPLAALLTNDRLRRLTLLFSYLVTWQPLLYNYVTLRPGDWAPLPWRDLIPVAVVMGPAWAYVLWYWLFDRRTSRVPTGTSPFT